MTEQQYIHVTKKENIFKRTIFVERMNRIPEYRDMLNDGLFRRFVTCFGGMITSDKQCIVYPVAFFKASDDFVLGDLTNMVMCVAKKFFPADQPLVAVAIVYISEGRFHLDGGYVYRNQFSKHPDIHGVNGFADEFAKTKYEYNMIVMTQDIWEDCCNDVESTLIK
jgi:hypothetical protein